MSVSPPPMAIHNSMVEICCYAAPIAMEITSESLDPHRVFQHLQGLPLIKQEGSSAAGLVYDLAMMRIPRLDYKVISGCWTEEDETSFAVTNDGLGYSERRAWAGSAAAARRAGHAEETSDSDSIRTTLAPNTIGLVALTPKRNAPTMR